MVIRSGGKCVFRAICPATRRVYVVGDFNRWSRTAVAMQPVARGIWQATLHLAPGTYRFRYFADDRWLIDHAAFGLLPNGFGGWDSVVWVPDASAAFEPAWPLRRALDEADAPLADLSRLDR